MSRAVGRYGGVIQSWGELFEADISNAIGPQIENIETASANWKVDSLVPGSMQMGLRDLRDYFPYKSMIAPFLHLSYMDPSNPGTRLSFHEQQGLFVVLPTSKDLIGAGVTQNVTAYDITWLLSQRSCGDPISLAVGVNPVDYIQSKLNLFGFRHRITETTHTLTKEFTWRTGTAWITIFNDLLNAIGYYQLWSDRYGVLVSMPIRTLANVESQASFSTDMGDIGEHVTLDPDQLHIRNDIIVIGNAPTNDPIVVQRTNIDRSSPTSIYGLRSSDDADPVYLTLVEEDSSIESYAAATSLANRLLEERSSLFTRLSLDLVPWPGLHLHEPIDVEIETDGGYQAAEGKWWWDEMGYDLTDSAASMTLRCNKLLDLDVA